MKGGREGEREGRIKFLTFNMKGGRKEGKEGGKEGREGKEGGRGIWLPTSSTRKS